MSRPPPLEIGTTIITPDPPLPEPIMPLPVGYVAQPLQWNKNISQFTSLSQVVGEYKHPSSSVSVFVVAASYLKRLNDAYVAAAANIMLEVDTEISSLVGPDSSTLEALKTRKSIIDGILLLKGNELVENTIKSRSFFGRGLFEKDFKTNAVDFTNMFYSTAEGTDAFYNRFAVSSMAAYNVRALSEQIRILNERSVVLINSIEIAQALEDVHLLAEAEVARIAAEDAEQARLAAEAETYRKMNEIEQQARIAEAVQIANTFRALGSVSAGSSLFISSAGTLAVIDAALVTLRAAVRSAIAILTGLAAGTASGLLVGVSALVYSPKLANGELPERYAFSTPLSDLAPEFKDDLSAIAAANGTVDLPVRISSKTAADGQSEVFVAKTDGVTVPSQVRVIAATFNAQQNVYSVTTEDVPPRTLTWTPIVDPGNSSTTLPAEQPETPVCTGATVTPVVGRIDTFPGLAEAGFDDFITVFPTGSGLPPIYVMFRDPREDAGVATGMGQPVTGIWLGAAAQGEGAPVPSQIADQLQGKEFRNFRAFREAFWVEIAKDSELSEQFIVSNRARMNMGKAPKARRDDAVGKRSTFEIHHVQEIAKGGDVYNIENMMVLTPKRHMDIHKGKNNGI